MKTKHLILMVIVLGLVSLFLIFQPDLKKSFPSVPADKSVPQDSANRTPDSRSIALKNQINILLQQSESTERTLALPNPPAAPTELKKRAAGEDKQEEKKPPEADPPPPQIIGVVLADKIPVYTTNEGWDILCSLQTGDLISPLSLKPVNNRIQIKPRVDVFLAATTQLTESAGSRYPNTAGWIEPSQIQILDPDRAEDYTQGIEAFTLGEDPNFSMVDFYTRAMKNPDRAVHRIVGARLIALVSLHEDYNSSWIQLYRDPDPRLRSLALSTLRQRGVGHSRLIVDDLIARLAELTKIRATGDEETEVLLILDILKASQHSRVPSAFASFREAWAGKQSQKIMDSLHL